MRWGPPWGIPCFRWNKVIIFSCTSNSPHKVKGVVDAIEEKGAYVLWLPTYSPDLNPVEQLWSKVKAHLRKMKARTMDALFVALKDALDAVSLSDIMAWFAMANYSVA